MGVNLYPHRSWLMNAELKCGAGWIPLIERTLREIGTVMARNPAHKMCIIQIKEKLGGLRLYYQHEPAADDTAITDDLRRILDRAKALSFRTCDTYGAAGKATAVKASREHACITSNPKIAAQN